MGHVWARYADYAGALVQQWQIQKWRTSVKHYKERMACYRVHTDFSAPF